MTLIGTGNPLMPTLCLKVWNPEGDMKVSRTPDVPPFCRVYGLIDPLPPNPDFRHESLGQRLTCIGSISLPLEVERGVGEGGRAGCVEAPARPLLKVGGVRPDPSGSLWGSMGGFGLMGCTLPTGTYRPYGTHATHHL